MDNQRYFLNPEAVSRHLYCSICQDVFNEPQRAPCGHSFCKMCIHTWMKQSKSCPEDRRAITLKDLHYDFILANIIGDQMVACPFRSKGCEYVDKLESLAGHKKVCTFNPLNLPEYMKEDSSTTSSTLKGADDNVFDDEKLPTPAKPSLKMRLFCDKNKRQLLQSVFEPNVHKPSTSNSSNKENIWLSKERSKTTKEKRPRVLSIDDSF